MRVIFVYYDRKIPIIYRIICDYIWHIKSDDDTFVTT